MSQLAQKAIQQRLRAEKNAEKMSISGRFWKSESAKV